MIIYKMPVPLDDHLQPHPQKGKGNEKCIFETFYYEIKCVLSINESNFKEKMEQVIKVKFATYKQNWDFGTISGLWS